MGGAVQFLPTPVAVRDRDGTFSLDFDLPDSIGPMRSFWSNFAHVVRALDIAKALLDRGYHAPTIYFPLLVPECIMIEPTETESKETLDGFIDALREIVATAKSDPQKIKDAPVNTVVGRIDETRAARQPDLRWQPSS